MAVESSITLGSRRRAHSIRAVLVRTGAAPRAKAFSVVVKTASPAPSVLEPATAVGQAAGRHAAEYRAHGLYLGHHGRDRAGQVRALQLRRQLRHSAIRGRRVRHGRRGGRVRLMLLLLLLGPSARGQRRHPLVATARELGRRRAGAAAARVLRLAIVVRPLPVANRLQRLRRGGRRRGVGELARVVGFGGGAGWWIEGGTRRGVEWGVGEGVGGRGIAREEGL
jgi:hypothetical protein